MGNGTTFQYFTYFINVLDQKALFSDKREKNEIFKELLRKKIEYESRKVKHAMVLIKEKDGFFAFKLGKKASIKRHLPPEQEFKETLEESWPYCLVIINTNAEDGKGQKVAFEYKSNVFSSPSEQLKYFEEEINTSLASSGYTLAINPVTEEREFWKTVEENKDKIERLTLTFSVPNLFGLNNSLTEDLKELEKEYGSTKVSIELENPAGKLKVPKTELTNQGVDYITRGGGEYQLRVKGKVVKSIKSKDSIYTRTFEDLDVTLKGSDQESMFNLLGRIFE